MKRELIVRWVAAPSEAPRIRELLPELVEKTRAEPGNLHYAVYESEADPGTFVLHERYADDAAAAAHRDSEHYRLIVAGQIVPRLAAREVIGVRQLY